MNKFLFLGLLSFVLIGLNSCENTYEEGPFEIKIQNQKKTDARLIGKQKIWNRDIQNFKQNFIGIWWSTENIQIDDENTTIIRQHIDFWEDGDFTWGVQVYLDQRSEYELIELAKLGGKGHFKVKINDKEKIIKYKIDKGSISTWVSPYFDFDIDEIKKESEKWSDDEIKSFQKNRMVLKDLKTGELSKWEKE